MVDLDVLIISWKHYIANVLLFLLIRRTIILYYYEYGYTKHAHNLPSTVLLVQYHIFLYTARFILVNMTEVCRWRVNYFFPVFVYIINLQL